MARMNVGRRRVLTLALSILSASVAVAAQRPAKTMKVAAFKIEGMTCAGCEAAVRVAAKRVDGVESATVSYKAGRAEVTYDPEKTTPDTIARTITEKSGYKATVLKPSEQGNTK